MEDEKAKKRAKTLTGIDQRKINQEDSLLKTKGVIQLEMIEENKGVLDAIKRSISKEIVWQKMFICTMKKKQTKI